MLPIGNVLLINQSRKSLKCLVAGRGLTQRVSDPAVSKDWRGGVGDEPAPLLYPPREGPVLALADTLGIRIKRTKAVPGVPRHEHRVAGDGIDLVKNHTVIEIVSGSGLVKRMPLPADYERLSRE